MKKIINIPQYSCFPRACEHHNPPKILCVNMISLWAIKIAGNYHSQDSVKKKQRTLHLKDEFVDQFYAKTLIIRNIWFDMRDSSLLLFNNTIKGNLHTPTRFLIIHQNILLYPRERRWHRRTHVYLLLQRARSGFRLGDSESCLSSLRTRESPLNRLL